MASTITPTPISAANPNAGVAQAYASYLAANPALMPDGKTPNPNYIATLQAYIDKQVYAVMLSYYNNLVNLCPTCGKQLPPATT